MQSFVTSETELTATQALIAAQTALRSIRSLPAVTLSETSLGFTQLEASFGSYQIDENSHTFIFHVEGAMVRTLIGKDLPRAYEMSGNQLVVKSTNPSEHWRVAWEHY